MSSNPFSMFGDAIGGMFDVMGSAFTGMGQVFNPAAVTPGSPKQPTGGPQQTTQQVGGSQQSQLGGMNMDFITQLFGGVAQGMDPGGVGGQLGGMAQQNLQKRQDTEAIANLPELSRLLGGGQQQVGGGQLQIQQGGSQGPGIKSRPLGNPPSPLRFPVSL